VRCAPARVRDDRARAKRVAFACGQRGAEQTRRGDGWRPLKFCWYTSDASGRWEGSSSSAAACGVSSRAHSDGCSGTPSRFGLRGVARAASAPGDIVRAQVVVVLAGTGGQGWLGRRRTAPFPSMQALRDRWLDPISWLVARDSQDRQWNTPPNGTSERRSNRPSPAQGVGHGPFFHRGTAAEPRQPPQKPATVKNESRMVPGFGQDPPGKPARREARGHQKIGLGTPPDCSFLLSLHLPRGLHFAGRCRASRLAWLLAREGQTDHRCRYRQAWDLRWFLHQAHMM